jgi:hypothetical protein
MPDEIMTHILQLPDEVLTKIFSFLPDHHAIREVCRWFNEISCRMKFFKIQLRSQWNESYAQILDDEETFKSMLTSQRRMNAVEISSESYEDIEITEDQKDRLIQVMKYFSENVKHFELSGNVLTPFVLEVLDLLPNIEKITLNNVGEMTGEVAMIPEVSLKKLTEIESSGCSANVLRYFSELPPGALQSLKLLAKDSSPEPDASIELFKNQHNIKEIVASTKLAELIDFQHMKLQTLTLKGPKLQLSGVINGQSEMTKLVLDGIQENDLILICSELTSLKELEVSAVESKSFEFIHLSKLSKLELLKLSFTKIENPALNECLSFLQNSSLLSLDIYSYHNEVLVLTVESLGLNCPKLQKLKITSRSFLDIINPIIDFFPSLVDLELNGITEKPDKPFEFKAEKFHQNLRKLVLFGLKTENSEFIKMVNFLENLEEFRITKPINHEAFRDIMIAHPRLKIFDMSPQWHLITNDHILTEEFVEVIKTHGRRLDLFKAHFRFASKSLDLEKLEQELKETHSNVYVNDMTVIVELGMEK